MPEFKKGDILFRRHTNFDASYKSHSGDYFKTILMEPSTKIVFGSNHVTYPDSINITFTATGTTIHYIALRDDFKLKNKTLVFIKR